MRNRKYEFERKEVKAHDVFCATQNKRRDPKSKSKAKLERPRKENNGKNLAGSGL